ncbi:MAG TPA: type II toxin-antitoxin system VapC family toxin [Bdellovibrionota bacterium]|nr:type II toxin-antitoxin system VapC family toxin [Bdellovibrionota bacterium]
MKFLLDTHVLLWWYLDVPKLPDQFKRLLDGTERAGEGIGVSIITLWEIAKLTVARKFMLSLSIDQWFRELEEDPLVHLLPLNGAIVLDSTRLGGRFPNDPADQLIAATARTYGLSLMTVDGGIRESGVVRVADI